VRLWPRRPAMPVAAVLLLIAIPERTFAVSRVNNDVLLEALAALAVLGMTVLLRSGLTARRALALGLLIGLGAWVKTSMAILFAPLLVVLWLRRGDRGWWTGVLLAVGAAGLLGLSLAARNWVVYGDLTGFAGFDRLHKLAAVDLSALGIVRAALATVNHLWVVWWKQAEVGSNGLVTLFFGAMGVALVTALVRVVTQPRLDRRVTALYLVVVLLYAGSVLVSYLRGMVPVPQGRFLLPAIVPLVLLMTAGLTGERRWWVPLAGVVALLWGMNLLAVFGNLVPYYYYWSGVVAGLVPSPGQAPLGDLLAATYTRLLADKPPALAPLITLLPVLYLVGLLGAGAALAAARPAHTVQEQSPRDSSLARRLAPDA
jgi:4-amino-4-deoxy-L-arabinose transferase-like glycosyltransferase